MDSPVPFQWIVTIKQWPTKAWYHVMKAITSLWIWRVGYFELHIHLSLEVPHLTPKRQNEVILRDTSSEDRQNYKCHLIGNPRFMRKWFQINQFKSGCFPNRNTPRLLPLYGRGVRSDTKSKWGGFPRTRTFDTGWKKNCRLLGNWQIFGGYFLPKNGILRFFEP